MPKDKWFELFLSKLENVKDEHLHLMRGHLLIEQKLHELVAARVKKPEALSDAKLSFNQILCIAEAIYWEKDSNELWQAIRKLNNIRNSYSHKLETQKYDDAINEFLHICGNEEPYGLSTKTTLILAMCSIYRNLSELQETRGRNMKAKK